MYPRSPHGSILLRICEIKLDKMKHREQIYQETENKIKRRRALYPRSPHGSILLGICEIKLDKMKHREQIIKKLRIK